MSKFINKLTKKANHHKTINRSLQAIESLEARQLMTGDADLFDPGYAEANLVAEFATGGEQVANQQVAAGQHVADQVGDTVNAMKSMAESTGQIALDQIDQFATFTGVTIEAPRFGLDASVALSLSMLP